ncbi:RNA ligase-domain-containing protein [Myxozyma melibiosi]|uniref:RNA ligase-domain-containing protein n=1 Tax=Myxozyma melibiosi TaxID=54550 RepID=A0ABR1EZM9_9ASCO
MATSQSLDPAGIAADMQAQLSLDTPVPGRILDLSFAKIQWPAETREKDTIELIDRLESMGKGKSGGEQGGKTGRRLIKPKRTVFEVPFSKYKVSGWRFMDWDFAKEGIPTRSRGLFTIMNDQDKTRAPVPEIVIRGYDKFYNINESEETKWRWISQNTSGPYELTQKENGCIIFMSGLPDGNLLVCSKHSIGVIHSEAGERWIENHLSKAGLTKRDLAATLRSLNCTAVGELCDDEFEEHVIEYRGDRAGLYLHGLNLNVPQFVTYPMEAVLEFANTFGFKPLKYKVVEKLETMQTFLEQCGKTGAWQGMEIEGFVVRCKATRSTSTPSGESVTSSDFFFKYKFEEPYFMYRSWRELTREMLNEKPINIKKHKKISEEYLKFARAYFRENKDLEQKFLQNHGIIKLRDEFLKYTGKAGSQIIDEEEPEDDSELVVRYRDDVAITSGRSVSQMLPDSVYKYILVTVATLGCGKTTLALALSRLFDWGPVQNDNISKSKGGAKRRFCEEIRSSLKTRQVAIADRNNPLRRERKQIFDDMSEVMPSEDFRYIALYFPQDLENLNKISTNKTFQVTIERVLNRGDNHQTIHPSADGEQKIAGIMAGFLRRFQPVDITKSPDSEIFSKVIELPVEGTVKANVLRVIKAISAAYPFLIPKKPTEEEIDAAIEYAMNYVPPMDGPCDPPKPKKCKPKPQSATSSQSSQKKRKVNYFALRIPSSRDDMTARLQELLIKHGADTTLLDKLLACGRVQPAFHVTLMHKAEKEKSLVPGMWDSYYNLMTSGALEKLRADVVCQSIVWNDKVMCFNVRVEARDLEIELEKGKDGEQTTTVNARSLLEPLLVRAVFHITIGTVDEAVKPVEAFNMLLSLAGADKPEDVGVTVCDVSGDDVVYSNLTPEPCL